MGEQGEWFLLRTVAQVARSFGGPQAEVFGASGKSRGRALTATGTTGDAHRFGRLVIVDRLATGGMAEISKVRDPEHSEALFALKRVRADWADEDDFRRMLLDEAALVQRLEHPNIAQVHEVVVDGDDVGILMELVEGLDLARFGRWLREQEPWSPTLAVYVVREVLEGLDFAHDARDEDGRYLHLVHRDVSPANIMLEDTGGVKLVDFGIAKARDGHGAHTEAGNVKGKFRYMAPEQIRAEAAEPATDIFSAAVVLWELLAGDRIHEGVAVPQLMIKVANAHVPSLRAARPGLPEPLYQAFERATALEPVDRFPSAKAFQEALDAALDEFDMASCRRALGERVRVARAERLEAGLKQAVAKARDVAGRLEGAILAALEAPDRVGSTQTEPEPAEVGLPPVGHAPDPTPTRTRAVALVEAPPRLRRRGPPPPSPPPTDGEEANQP